MIVDLLRNDLSRVVEAGQRRGAGAVRGRDLSDRAADDLDRHRRARGRARPGRPARGDLSPAARSPARPRSGRWRSSPGSRRRRAAPIAARSAGLRRTARPRSMSRSGRWPCSDGETRRPPRPRLRHRRGQRRRRRMARMPGEGRVCGDGPALRPDRDDALRSARGRRRARPPSRPDEGAAPRRSISPSTGTRRATTSRPRPSAPGRASSGCCCRASGALAIELRPLPAAPAEPVEVALAPLPVAADDFRLRHKTSDRAFYDEARAAAGAFEMVFARRGGLPHRRQLHQPVRRARRQAADPAAGARPAPRRAARAG